MPPVGQTAKSHFPAKLARLAVLTLLLASAILPAGSADEKRLAIYSPAASYSLSVVDRAGREYIGLLEVLEPLGQVAYRTDGLHWRLRFKNTDAEFTSGSNRAKIGRHDVDLAGSFVLENGRGLVPTSSLAVLLPKLLGGSINFNEGARRLFIGNVSTHFTAQLSRTTPPRLVINFTTPVNPTIATEPGKLRMSFRREPIVAPGSPTLTFGDRTIPSASYSENNGAAEITVNSGVPLMASFSNDGRTITIAPAPQQPVPTQPAAQAPAPASTAPPASSAGATPTALQPPQVVARSYYAVLDPSHGGDDSGAALATQLAEKDVTLAVARRLRQELESRGISAVLLRDSDLNMSADQRAGFANSARATIYIALHAASDGRGVRLYTSLLPAGGENNGTFLDWNTAQAKFLPASQTVAQGVAAEIQKKQIQVRTLAAPLRPLNSITAAAIAVEISPPGNDVMDLNLAAYQQNVASGVANGIAAAREKIGAQP